MCLSFSALTSQYDPSNVFFLRVIHVHWTVLWYIQNPSVFRITLKVYLECDCPEDSPCYTNEFSALTQQHRILIYFSSWEYYMSDVHWHIHQCLTEFPTNGLNIFPFQIVLDDCGNSSFQLFFRHILIDTWTQRNTVNVINETRFEKENCDSLTVKEH